MSVLSKQVCRLGAGRRLGGRSGAGGTGACASLALPRVTVPRHPRCCRPAPPPLVGPGAMTACAQRAQSCQDLLCNELAASWLPTLPLQSRTEANQLLFFFPPPAPHRCAARRICAGLLDGGAEPCAPPAHRTAPTCLLHAIHARTHERTHVETAVDAVFLHVAATQFRLEILIFVRRKA